MNKIAQFTSMVTCFILIGTIFSVTVSTNLSAAPILPRTYSGNVYIDGELALEGLKVKCCIDGVFYDDPATGFTNSTGGYSVVCYGHNDMVSYKNGAVVGDLIIFWVEGNMANESVFFIEGGSETLTINISTSVQPALLKINELLSIPSSGSDWVEIYNPTSISTDLSEYALFDTDKVVPQILSDTLPPNGFSQINYTGLASASDEIWLQWTDPLGIIAGGNPVVIDRVEYGDPGSGPDDTILSNAPAPLSDQSIILQPDGDDNDDPANDFTITDFPTPGASNGVINQPPVADAGPDDTVDEDTVYIFNGTGSYDPDGSIVNYTWDFGDGEFGYVENPAHIYIDPGYYEVNLTVRDDSGANSSDTVNITVLDITHPLPPTGLMANLVTGFLSNVNITWTASSDDGAGYDDVTGYTVYRSTNDVNGSYLFSAWIPAQKIPAYTYEWTDFGVGDGDLNNYFYIVRANDTSDNEEQNTNKVGKVVSYLVEGWNLVSTLLIQNDTTREIALQTIEGNYTSVYGYHAGKSKPWLHWHKDKPFNFNDIIEVNNKEGYYVDIINTDYLVVAGMVPTNEQISLKVGWNLVGYPSLNSRTVTDAFSSISGMYTKVYFHNVTAGRDLALNPFDMMYPGNGYWIHCNLNCVWEVPL